MVPLVTPEDAFALLEVLPRCVGLPDDEIDHYEAASGVAFPADFRRLLRVVGGSLGWIFPRGLSHPSQVGRLREEAAELFAESGWKPGPKDIVLEIHDQGCGANFIRGEGQVSRVYCYTEWAPGLEDTGMPFGLYLCSVLRRHLFPET